MHRLLALLLTALWLCGRAFAAPSFPQATGDRWMTNPAPHPGLRTGQVPDHDSFTNLHAEVLSGRLTVAWTPPAPQKLPTEMILHASAADTGQWPIRDWQAFPMKRSGLILQADVPCEDPDVPIVYYARLATGETERVSPLRVVYPRQLGLAQPTRVFWPFLEGFEEGFASWRLLSESGLPPLQTGSQVKNGRGSLRISLPARAASIRVGTTRVRGWQLVQEGATGLRVWVRTRSGAGEVRCSLQARTATTNLVAEHWPKWFPVNETWNNIDVQFDHLPILPWRSVDLFVLEFRAAQSTEFFVDDLQFLGPWKLESVEAGEQ